MGHQTKKARGPGIFGTTVAFAAGDEEQGRKTLHRHIQLWIKGVDQKLRRNLFHENESIRQEERHKFQQYIDKIMSACFGPDLVIPDDKQYTDSNAQTFRDARHKNLCKDVGGKIIQSDSSNSTKTPMDLFTYSLETWKESEKYDHNDERRPDTNPTPERIDMAAYCHSYNMPGGSNPVDDPFWGDKKIRQLLLRYHFDYHEENHRHSCFKKGCECHVSFCFPS